MEYTSDMPPTEEEFRDIVMLSSETMLPNKNTSIRLYGVDFPQQMAYHLRKFDLISINADRPLDLDLRYSQASHAFEVHKLYVPLQEASKAVIEKRTADDNYRVKLSRPGSPTIVPKRAMLNRDEVADAVHLIDLPDLCTVPDMPSEYRGWMSDVLAHSDSWSTREHAYIRRRQKAKLTASLVAIREAELFPRGGISSLRGVNYRIEDRTEHGVVAVSESFVGENVDNGSIDFSSHIQTSEYYPDSRQRRRLSRDEIILSPLLMRDWEARLTDPKTGVPLETN